MRQKQWCDDTSLTDVGAQKPRCDDTILTDVEQILWG